MSQHAKALEMFRRRVFLNEVEVGDGRIQVDFSFKRLEDQDDVKLYAPVFKRLANCKLSLLSDKFWVVCNHI